MYLSGENGLTPGPADRIDGRLKKRGSRISDESNSARGSRVLIITCWFEKSRLSHDRVSHTRAMMSPCFFQPSSTTKFFSSHAGALLHNSCYKVHRALVFITHTNK